VTMLGMILVDNQGNFNHVVRPLDESVVRYTPRPPPRPPPRQCTIVGD
jgi:hypothetical protein